MERSDRSGVENAFLVAGAMLFADQLTKYYVGHHPAGFSVFGVSVAKVLNPVGVFGFNISNTWLVVINAAICVLLLGLLIWRAKTPPTRLGLWLLLAGALSNLIDRAQHGGVIDIISISGGSRFNLADATIILGAISLVRSLWWKPRSR